MSGVLLALRGCCQGCTLNCCCCGTATKSGSKDRRNTSTVSAEGSDYADGISVRLEALRREFGNHVAVDNLTLELVEGEIFVLLGHNGEKACFIHTIDNLHFRFQISHIQINYLRPNHFSLLRARNYVGAGKTTTVSMLTGMLGRTSGDAVVYDRRLSGGMAPIRQLLGVCPQHDVLFDYLTVGELIDLFARLNSATLAEAARERTAMLEAFELAARVDYFPKGATYPVYLYNSRSELCQDFAYS